MYFYITKLKGLGKIKFEMFVVLVIVELVRPL